MDTHNIEKKRRLGFSASKLSKEKALSLLKKSSEARRRVRKNITSNTLPRISKFVSENI